MSIRDMNRKLLNSKRKLKSTRPNVLS